MCGRVGLSHTRDCSALLDKSGITFVLILQNTDMFHRAGIFASSELRHHFILLILQLHDGHLRLTSVLHCFRIHAVVLHTEHSHLRPPAVNGVQFASRFYAVQSRHAPDDRSRFRPRVPGQQAVQFSAGFRALRLVRIDELDIVRNRPDGPIFTRLRYRHSVCEHATYTCLDLPRPSLPTFFAANKRLGVIEPSSDQLWSFTG